MNMTLRAITFFGVLASTITLALAQSEPTLVVPFGRNKELVPSHDVYKFPYKENYIMLPLTNGQMVTEEGGMRVIVNKPVQINKRRTTVIPLGQGAPNISPTPIVPQGFNGGSVPLPVNRPEGAVVRRIYPNENECASTVLPAEQVIRTYEEPAVTERTEALPSVVVPENPSALTSPEHSIVTPNQVVPSETVPSPSTDTSQTTPSPYEVPANPQPSNTYEAPTTPQPSDPYEAPTTPQPSDPYEAPTTPQPSDPYEAPTTPQPSDPYEAPTTPQPSDPYEATTTPQPSDPYEAPTTPQPSDPYEATPSQETPAQTETPNDPYQPKESPETPQEPEAPTSAWRSSTSNPAETYDSGMVGESPMIMTRQESGRYENPWETQSSKPQMEETASPVVKVPTEQAVNQNPGAIQASQPRYVEVRPRRHSASRPAQTTTSPAPTNSPVQQPTQQPSIQYQPPREIPAQLPPPEPGTQTPKPSGDGRKV